jgi:prepilin-type N-terminal cleavage/methylation domain-containing protein
MGAIGWNEAQMITRVTRPAQRRPVAGGDGGFSLIETMIAMAILATGLLSLAGVFILGLNHLSNSSAALIAREKAREAVESVHTARDTRVITWCQIYNVASVRSAACVAAPAGVFVNGVQPLRKPGPDGLVNTADDLEIEEALSPGPDNVLGNADDVRTPLTGFTREIEITEIVTNGVANPNLRRVRVRIRYGSQVRNQSGVLEPERLYELTTYISSIS